MMSNRRKPSRTAPGQPRPESTEHVADDRCGSPAARTPQKPGRKPATLVSREPNDIPNETWVSGSSAAEKKPKKSGRKPSTPVSSEPSPIIRWVVAALESMPVRDSNAIINLLQFILELRATQPRSLAALALTLQPEMTRKELAALVGVHPRTLDRWEEVARAKPTRSEVRNIQSTPNKRQKQIGDKFIQLDNPN